MDISVEEYVSAVSKKRRPATVSNGNLDWELVLEITKYNNRDNITVDCDLLSFWKLNAKYFPKLNKIAMVVLGIPSTEVSVERTFSTLTYILGDQMMSIDGYILAKLLMVLLNEQYWDN